MLHNRAYSIYFIFQKYINKKEELYFRMKIRVEKYKLMAPAETIFQNDE